MSSLGDEDNKRGRKWNVAEHLLSNVLHSQLGRKYRTVIGILDSCEIPNPVFHRALCAPVMEPLAEHSGTSPV